MNLSVVIPSKTTANFLASAAAVRKHEPQAQIILVDDGVNLAQAFAFISPPFHYVTGMKPFIFARNVNIGILAAGDEDVVILNDDAILETPGGFTAMQTIANNNPEYGIIGAVTNVTGQILQQPRGIGLREVPHFAFVCVLIPRRTFDRVGPLDERYCLDYGVEDRDYCEMVKQAGLKVGVHDHCFVDHGQLQSSFRGDPNTGRSFAQNYELFKQKWGIAHS